MTWTNLRKSFGWSIACCLAGVLVLAGCGAGGGGSSGSSGGGTTTPTGTPTLVVSLADATTGAATTNITSANPATAKATILDGAGKPVPNTVVTFSVNQTGLITTTPPSGTALTDSTGIASIQIAPASLSAAGAATLTATATVASASATGTGSTGTVVTGSVGFSVAATTAGLSGLTYVGSPTALSAYSTTSITVNVTGIPTSIPVTVNFSSVCASSPVGGTGTVMKAKLTTSVQSVNGVATANYTDNGCAGTDAITASIAGTSVTSQLPLSVASPLAASIQFVSATPQSIAIKGTGGPGLLESSIIVFKVLDTNNVGVPNQPVTFDLTTRTGGIRLDALPGTVTKNTDSSGNVQVSVQSGTNPTPVWVTATTSGTTTQSILLRISTLRPAQDRFSVSFAPHNIEGWDYDGVTSTVTARASDRIGNPVPDGTAINFITEGGQIQPSCVTTDGACSVTFTSANPRPGGPLGNLDSEPSTFHVTAGRSTVLAYALGEESFTDLAGTNVFAAGDPFNDLGDVFINNNESRDATTLSPTWDSGEQVIPFGAIVSGTCVPGIPSSPLAPSKVGTGDCHWGHAHVRQDGVITMSGSTAYLVPPASLSMGGACSATFAFRLHDINNNPMPAGTTLVAETQAQGVTLKNLGTPVIDTNAPGGTYAGFALTLAPAQCPLSGNASVLVTVTTPTKNISTTYSATITP